MKCFKCNEKADVLTTDSLPICLHCAEQEGYIVCPETGKVIADQNFHCDNICNDCIWKEKEKN